MDHHPDKPLDPALSLEFLAGVYAQLPMLVVRLTGDGIVVSVNPQAELVTGYALDELKGKNWWGILFPGKLFAQVPKFTAPQQTGGMMRDYPLAMRTASGQVRIVAWTRFGRQEPATGQMEVVCLGMDITDRLMDADRQATGADSIDLDCLGECPTLPPDGAATVEPLAVSPPAAMKPELWREGVEQARLRLAAAEERVEALVALMEASDTARMRLLLRITRGGPGERALAPTWGQIETMYGRLDAALAQGVGAEARELGDMVKQHDRA